MTSTHGVVIENVIKVFLRVRITPVRLEVTKSLAFSKNHRYCLVLSSLIFL
jgi:hypothetical protein